MIPRAVTITLIDREDIDGDYTFDMNINFDPEIEPEELDKGVVSEATAAALLCLETLQRATEGEGGKFEVVT